MRNNMKRDLAIGGVAGAALLAALALPNAAAHHPDVEATVACVGGSARVDVRATSWMSDTEATRHNDDITISWDGVVAARGSFLPENGYTFQRQLVVPADGRSHVVRATAVAAFGKDRQLGFDGAFRETTITLPETCLAPTTTVPTTTVPIIIAPVTTVTSTSIPTTTIAAAVLSATVPAAVAATPIAVQPNFTG